MLKRVVEVPFTDAVKSSLGYSDENIPVEKVESEVRAGPHVFVVSATPRLKRYSASDLYGYIATRLETMAKDYSESKRPAGILTIDGKPYARASDLVLEIDGKKAEEQKAGTTLKIESEPRPIAGNRVVVALGGDYTRLSPENADTYLRSAHAIETFGSIVKEFERQLKEATGYGKANLPEDTAEFWLPIGSHLFRVLSVPYPSPSYAAVVDSLFGNGEKKKRPGEVQLALAGQPTHGLLAPKERDGSVYVSLLGLQSRLAGLLEENTKPALRQNIEHYPLAGELE